MESQTLRNLVEGVVGSEDSTLILLALEQFEIQSEIRLTEGRATRAAQRAIDYLAGEARQLASTRPSLSQRCQMIADHLLAS